MNNDAAMSPNVASLVLPTCRVVMLLISLINEFKVEFDVANLAWRVFVNVPINDKIVYNTVGKNEY